MSRLTSSEIGNLWRMYMNYTMLSCVMQVILKHTQDPDIKNICEKVLDMAHRRAEVSAHFLSQDNRSIPRGFTDEDIDLEAPALYSDMFYLYYLKNMARIGLNVLSMALTMSTRLDVIEFFKNEIAVSLDLWSLIAKVMLEKGIMIRQKGIMIRPPFMETLDEVRYVQDKDSFVGSIWGGSRRPLLSGEIEQLFFGIISNEVGKTLLTGFHQVTPHDQLRDYIKKGCDLSGDMIDNFSSKLRDGGITSPMHWDAYGAVTDSTTPPFSDKLMMFHINMLNTIGMANYAVSLGSAFRRDLVAMYGRYMSELALYAAKGLDLAIENGWLEEPPSYVDRQSLTNRTQH